MTYKLKDINGTVLGTYPSMSDAQDAARNIWPNCIFTMEGIKVNVAIENSMGGFDLVGTIEQT